MPGYDGTGPRGEGPLTGRGDGYCVIELPKDPEQTATGFLGLDGAPTKIQADPCRPSQTRSSAQLAGIKGSLRCIAEELEELEAATRRISRMDEE